MKKEYVIGGIAVIGVIALLAFLKKPKRNSDGFYSAEGNYNWCARRNPDGSTLYFTTLSSSCPKGSVRAKRFGDRSNL